MVENLFNYTSSFAVSSSDLTMRARPSENYVPFSVMQQWYSNFERRLQQNPYFWKTLWLTRSLWCAAFAMNDAITVWLIKYGIISNMYVEIWWESPTTKCFISQAKCFYHGSLLPASLLPTCQHKITDSHFRTIGVQQRLWVFAHLCCV